MPCWTICAAVVFSWFAHVYAAYQCGWEYSGGESQVPTAAKARVPVHAISITGVLR